MKRQNGQSVRELFLQLLRTRMALRRALQRTLRKNDAGISFEMLQVINRLYDHPGFSQQHLAESIYKSKASTSNIIANLEKRGYVRREEDPSDRRNRKVFLTEEGILFHYRLMPMTEDVYAFTEERFGKEKALEIKKMLKELYDVLETY